MKRFAHALCLTMAGTLAAPAAAQSPTSMLDVRILPGWQKADGTHMAAIHIDMDEGWKTYWRSPGDAGIPPSFDWSGSRNLAGVAVNWPTPERQVQGGVQTIGYSGTLTLPLTLTPTQAHKAIRLKGEMHIGICKEVCIPVTLKLSQDLPKGQAKPDPRIVAALANRPYSAAEARVGRVACTISPMTDGLHLRAEVDLPSAGKNELAVIETDNPDVWVAQPKTRRSGGRLIAETELYHNAGRAFALNRSALRITVLGSKHAVDIRGCPAQ